MSASPTLTVDLSPDVARIVQDAVQAGDFPDASALVEAVLRNWNGHRDDLLGFGMEELRRLGDEGEASGPGEASGTALVAAMQASPHRDVELVPTKARTPVRDVRV